MPCPNHPDFVPHFCFFFNQKARYTWQKVMQPLCWGGVVWWPLGGFSSPWPPALAGSVVAECEAAGLRFNTMVPSRKKSGVSSLGSGRRSCPKSRSSSTSGSCLRVRAVMEQETTGRSGRRLQCFPGEAFRAQDRKYVFWLTWERFGIFPEELDKVAGENEARAGAHLSSEGTPFQQKRNSLSLYNFNVVLTFTLSWFSAVVVFSLSADDAGIPILGWTLKLLLGMFFFLFFFLIKF